MNLIRIFSILLVGMLTSCASDSLLVQGLRFNSIEIVNQTRDDIRNMNIEVTEFHSKFTCGIILHRSTCMIGFHPRELQGNDIEITWEARHKKHQIGPVRVVAPAEYDPSVIYTVQFVFKSVNQISVEFKPASY